MVRHRPSCLRDALIDSISDKQRNGDPLHHIVSETTPVLCASQRLAVAIGGQFRRAFSTPIEWPSDDYPRLSEVTSRIM